MSIDPSELIQAGSTLYETGQGSTYIPTTSAGGVGFMVMSYPGRPPMGPMQGMPPSMPMPYMQLGGPPPLMQAMQMPMPPHHMIQAPPMPAMSAPPIRYRQHHAPPLRINSFPKRPPVVEPNGPPVTVFVGNITERAPDAMIRHILAACGNVVSWKRVQAFGFCEFGSPDSGLRAIRLLHDMELGGKKLVAKVDAKTKTVLDEYKAERRKKQSGQSPLQDENPDEDDYMDEGMKQTDAHTLERILAVLEDYEVDMNNFVETVSKSERNKSSESKDRKMSRTQEKLLRLSQGEGGPNDMILDDVDIEEGKRDLITREIGKFREIMKKQEEEKEVERRRKEREHDASATTRARSPQSTGSPVRSKDGSRSPSQDSLYTNKIRTKGHRPRRSYSRERERERDVQRDRERERETHRERERERERDRDRERERERDRDREREDAVKKSEREVHKEKEMEEEAKEKKKADRKAKEKEAAYQERLRNWETRERRKHKDAEKEKEREKAKEEEREREAKRLKEFLEDYDDERDDSKYYKGRELQRRLTERKKEVELDARDRQKEKEELEELKTKIFAEDHHDPDLEFERLRKEVEDQYKPKILISVTHEQSRQRERERERERLTEEIRREEEEEALAKQRQEEMEAAEEELRRRRSLSRDRSEEERAEREAPLPQTEMIESDEDEDDHRSPSPPPPPPPFEDETSQTSVTSSGVDNDKREAGVVINWNSPQQQQQQTASSGPTVPVAKKKKLDMKEVFNTDDDDDNSLGAGKKRKLVPLDYGPDEKKRLKEEAAASGKSQEEKRKHIKTLIDKIPTDKTALFAFTLDWSAVDNQLMERRIRPWINKKIIEYIGEPEPTLVDFICSKVLAGSAPQGILDDVQMVLDEEAEVFVVKMWRLLIYEIEAKKLGLVK